MHPDIAAIASGLSEAQRRALVGATVRKPSSFIPNYRPIEMPCCGMGGGEAEELAKMGLVTLPIRSGGRCGPSVYHGEIHEIGLQVRDHLRSAEGGEG